MPGGGGGGGGAGSEQRGHGGDQLIFRNSATRSTIAQPADLATLCYLLHAIPAAIDLIDLFFWPKMGPHPA